MTRFTLAQIREMVEDENDLQEETFVDDDEVTNFINRAIDAAEQLILTIREDYFLTSYALPLVSGTSEYALPSTIYANKIRAVIYQNGLYRYPIRRIRDWRKFESIADINAVGSALDYRYILIHDSASADYKMKLYPASRETSSTVATVYFLRNANRLSSESDVCDVPEALNFILAHVSESVLRKEFGGEAPPEAIQRREKEEARLVQALTEQTPDNDDTIQMDLDFYEEHT